MVLVKLWGRNAISILNFDTLCFRDFAGQSIAIENVPAGFQQQFCLLAKRFLFFFSIKTNKSIFCFDLGI